MNIFSFFLFLFALMASLAKSWRYAIGFALAGAALWIGLGYLASRPETAADVLAKCNETQQQDGTQSTECITKVMMNLASPKEKNGRCVYDIAVFRSDPATIDPRVAAHGDALEGWTLLTLMSIDWMKAHPDQLDLPAKEVIGNAIASRFPCPANPS